MLNEILARKIPVLAGMISGALAAALLLALQGDDLGNLLPPAATALAGLVGYLWTGMRTPRGSKDARPKAVSDDLFAWVFGSLTAALALHSFVQAGVL